VAARKEKYTGGDLETFADPQRDYKVSREMLPAEKDIEMAEAVMKEAEEIEATCISSAFTREVAAEDEIWSMFYEHKTPENQAPNKEQQQEEHWASKAFMAEWEGMAAQMGHRRVAPAHILRYINSRKTDEKHSGTPFPTQTMSRPTPTYTFPQGIQQRRLPFHMRGPPFRPPVATYGNQHGNCRPGKKALDKAGNEDYNRPEAKNLNLLEDFGGLCSETLKTFLNQYMSADKTSKIGQAPVKQEYKKEKTKCNAEEAKRNRWEAGNKDFVQSRVYVADARARGTRSCKVPNADLLERLRKVDRKYFALKVDTLPARRLKTTTQETFRRSRTHNDLKQSPVPISACFMTDPTQEDELHDDKEEIASLCPTRPELFQNSKAKEDNAKGLASLMGFGSWAKLSDEKKDLYYNCELGVPSPHDLLPHKDEEKPSMTQLRRNPFSFEFTSSSATEKLLERNLEKTVSADEDYPILREEPLVLQSKFPVLRLRPAFQADGTAIIPKSLTTKKRTGHYDGDMHTPDDMMVNPAEYIYQEEIDEKDNVAIINSDRLQKRNTRFCLGGQSDGTESNFYGPHQSPKKDTIVQFGSSSNDATFLDLDEYLWKHPEFRALLIQQHQMKRRHVQRQREREHHRPKDQLNERAANPELEAALLKLRKEALEKIEIKTACNTEHQQTSSALDAEAMEMILNHVEDRRVTSRLSKLAAKTQEHFSAAAAEPAALPAPTSHRSEDVEEIYDAEPYTVMCFCRDSNEDEWDNCETESSTGAVEDGFEIV
jgi:hypothetical protein